MITELPYYFDSNNLLEYYLSIKNRGTLNQVSLSYRPGHLPYQDGCGSAYLNNNRDLKILEESDFTSIAEGADNPIFEVISALKDIAKSKFNVHIGRIRFMTLPPKTCLSYHVDDEAIRFHIPITTNRKCFFVINDQVMRMEKVGQLYTLKTDVYHTPVNANLNFERTHLVFNTY